MPAHSLEQEAMERVRRMYTPFERAHGAEHEPVHQEPVKEDEPEPAAEEPDPQVHTEQKERQGMLELLMKDKDRSLILLLLVILVRDGADMNMILALVYLLI